MRIFVINPGSTSTKIAVYEDGKQVFAKNITYSAEELLPYEHVTEQLDLRLGDIYSALAEAGIPLDFDAVVARGPLCKPVKGGVYSVTSQMVHQAWHAEHMHACDLGCVLADRVASNIEGCKCYIADPGTVDELNDYARISGSPHCERICIWHALNQREIVRRYAASIGKRYEDLNVIGCHMGGGISVCAHDHGQAVDVNNALDGEGPFSPERAGTLPAVELVKLCYSGRYTQQQLLKRIAGKAGLTAHLGTNNVIEIFERIATGDAKAKLMVDAMIYHIAKAIAAQGAVLFGKVDAILLTGGMANSDYIVDGVKRRVEYLAPVHVYPGEGEMEALASNAIAALTGACEVMAY